VVLAGVLEGLEELEIILDREKLFQNFLRILLVELYQQQIIHIGTHWLRPVDIRRGVDLLLPLLLQELLLQIVGMAVNP